MDPAVTPAPRCRQEVKSLQAQVADSALTVEVDAPKSQDLGKIMAEIRAQYDALAQKNLEDLEKQWGRQVGPSPENLHPGSPGHPWGFCSWGCRAKGWGHEGEPQCRECVPGGPQCDMGAPHEEHSTKWGPGPKVGTLLGDPHPIGDPETWWGPCPRGSWSNIGTFLG